MRVLTLFFAALSFCALHAQQWNWAADAGGGGNTDFCYGIATDSQGNAYWVGTVSGTAEFGCATIAAGNTIVGVVAKYSPTGTCQWVRGITTGFYDAWVYDIVIDHEDRIYITGSCQGDADFGNGIVLDGSGSSDDWFTARYSVDGECVWAQRITDSNGNSEGRGIEVDAEGGIYVTGFAGGSGFSFGDVVVENGGFTRQTVIVKYDSTGTALWGKSTNGTSGGRCSARGISVAGDRLYVTGQVYFATTAYQGVPITTASTAACIFVICTDLHGDPIWVKSFGGSDHEGFGIAADTLGNLFLTGRLFGNLHLPDDTLASATEDDDILLMGLSADDGDLRWAERIGAQNQDDGWDVVCDGQGNGYFAAHFENTVDVFGTPFTALGSEDALIMKIEADGDLVWAARPSGFERDIPLTIHRQELEPHQLYFGGYFWGAITYGSTTIDDVLNGDAMIVAGIDTTFDASSSATFVCQGSCDGVAHVFANGLAPFSYQWSNGATTPSIEGLCAGELIVQVTDADGSMEMDTVEVLEHEPVEISIQVEGDSLWVEVEGSDWIWELDGLTVGAGEPYHIAWASGTYVVRFTDEHGCTGASGSTNVVLNVGLDERTLTCLHVQPNPGSDRVMVYWNGTVPTTAELFNAAGQRVATSTLTPGANVLDLNELEPGVYLLRSADGAVVRVGRK